MLISSLRSPLLQVRVLCNKTCNACRCPPSKVQRGRCKHSKKKGWRRLYVVRKYKRYHGMCIVFARKIYRKCKPPKRCPVNSFRIIRRCKGGIRKILTVTNYQTKNYRCKRSISVLKKNCQGCEFAGRCFEVLFNGDQNQLSFLNRLL